MAHDPMVEWAALPGCEQPQQSSGRNSRQHHLDYAGATRADQVIEHAILR